MERQLTAKDILEAREVHFYDGDTLFVVFGDDKVYGFHKGGDGWYKKNNFWDYFDSSLMMSYFECLTNEQAAELYEKWMIEAKEAKERLDKSVIFATERHSGQVRKGTTLPYIVHPIEVMQILYRMGADENVMIAGVLHDTIEDTGTTKEEILDLFGEDVANLVAGHSEDKSKSWEECKLTAIEHLAKSDKRFKMLVMADKLSNMRAIAADYAAIGDKLWERFNAPPEKQAWYYGKLDDALMSLADYDDTADAYWEFNALFKDVFVKFYRYKDTLYQICLDGTGSYLKKDTTTWKPFEKKLPTRARQMTRFAAEKLEDAWGDGIYFGHDFIESDLDDAVYKCYSSKDRCITVKIKDKKFTLCCEDSGSGCECMTGDDEYEFYYELDEDNTRRFIEILRAGYNNYTADDFKAMVTKFFGDKKSTVTFEGICKREKIKYTFISI